MAIRTIREIGDEVLTMPCRPVKEMNAHTKELIGDMFDTMYDRDGVGLAAPQVGVLKQIVVIDVSGAADAEGDEEVYCLINPRIVETSGEQEGYEGCLSVPNKTGIVTRPDYVKVVALDADMKEITVEGRGLLARALCHEIDHLQGILYTEKVEGELKDVRTEDDDE